MNEDNTDEKNKNDTPAHEKLSWHIGKKSQGRKGCV